MPVTHSVTSTTEARLLARNLSPYCHSLAVADAAYAGPDEKLYALDFRRSPRPDWFRGFRGAVLNTIWMERGRFFGSVGRLPTVEVKRGPRSPSVLRRSDLVPAQQRGQVDRVPGVELQPVSEWLLQVRRPRVELSLPRGESANLLLAAVVKRGTRTC